MVEGGSVKVEQIGDATLYCGDARNVLRVVHGMRLFDRVITDPVWPNCPRGALPGADGSQHELCREVLSLLNASTVVIVLGFDSDPRFLSVAPTDLAFVRSQQLPYAMPGYRGRLLGGDEMAYVFGEIPKGRGVIPGRAKAVTSPKAERANGHPTPRADEHMESLVGWWSLPGEVVIDPFMGAGSVAVACARLGRKFAGIEIEERYFDIACERIDNAYRQRKLFA